MTTHTQSDHHKTKQTSSEFCGLPICVITSSVDGFITSKQIHYMFTLVAERSEANNRDLWAQQSQLASIYIYIYIYIYIFPYGRCLSRLGGPGAATRVQNGVSGSYMDAVFELVAPEDSDVWTNLPHPFTREGLLQLPG